MMYPPVAGMLYSGLISFQGVNIPEPQKPVPAEPSSGPNGKTAKSKPTGKIVKRTWDEERANFLARVQSEVPKVRPLRGLTPRWLSQKSTESLQMKLFTQSRAGPDTGRRDVRVPDCIQATYRSLFIRQGGGGPVDEERRIRAEKEQYRRDGTMDPYMRIGCLFEVTGAGGTWPRKDLLNFSSSSRS
ncbi:hypothetical protein BDM02DRAFT_3259719 [Thelephora ganbajun]|uniref:Uncharacterized protein n=1 Tax=Thelephora ganbajun TaxID=370292 RepID=A0ACB6ZMA1_THEGA|nr:hypothetical protein BDM02DRAFT_3259719 [Thelephora ganbajun]